MSIADYNRIFSKPSNKQMQLEFEDGTVITNEHICSEEMSIEEALCSDENLRFGACEASCFKIRIVNSGSFEGQELDVSMILKGKNGHIITSDGDNLVDSNGNYITYADYSAQGLTIPYGKYKVYSDKPTNDRMWRDLECYDAMYDILNADVTAWYLGLTFPMTLKNFRDSFFNEVGITQETTTLINDNLSILGGFVSEGVLSGKTIIEAICEVNAVFGHINRNGVFEYISLPSQETIEYEWYIADTGTYEDYDTETITRVMARSEGEDSVPDAVGVAGNDLILENNPLLYGHEGTATMTTALTNILNAVSQISYKPFEVETYGNPMLPVGTSIQINTKKYDHEDGYTPLTINSLVIRRTLSGIQALKDTISAEGNRYRPTEVNSLQSELTRTKGRVHTLVNNVNELTSEIYEVDPQTGQKTSRIEQTAEQIVLKVDSNGEMVEVELGTDPDDSSATAFNVKATNVNFSAFNLNMQSTNFSLTSDAITLDKNGLVVNGTYWKSTIGEDTFKINSNYTGNKEVVTLGVVSDTSLASSLTGSGALQLNHTSSNYNLLARNNLLLLSSVAPYTSNSSAYQGELQVDRLVLGCANRGSSSIIGAEKVWIRNVSNSYGVVMVGGSTSADVQIRDDILNPTSTISLRTLNTRVGSLGPTGSSSTPGDISVADSTWRSVAALNNLAAGKYLLIGSVRFSAQNGGSRFIVITTTNAGDDTSDRNSKTSQTNVSNAQVQIHAFKIINISSATTYHLNAYQTSGSTVTANAKLIAIRIGA